MHALLPTRFPFFGVLNMARLMLGPCLGEHDMGVVGVGVVVMWAKMSELPVVVGSKNGSSCSVGGARAASPSSGSSSLGTGACTGGASLRQDGGGGLWNAWVKNPYCREVQTPHMLHSYPEVHRSRIFNVHGSSSFHPEESMCVEAEVVESSKVSSPASDSVDIQQCVQHQGSSTKSHRV